MNNRPGFMGGHGGTALMYIFQVSIEY